MDMKGLIVGQYGFIPWDDKNFPEHRPVRIRAIYLATNKLLVKIYLLTGYGWEIEASEFVPDTSGKQEW